MTFDLFWSAWPRSDRKGAKSQCQAKWKKLKLDDQAETFIPAPLVYLNQQRWDGAEIPQAPEMTINVNVTFKDPALAKIEEDTKKAVAMPASVAEKLRELKKSIQLH
jgi:hypothetical protein